MNLVTSRLDEYDGVPLLSLTWRGRPCWIARYIGRVLGYGNNGKRLPTKILGEWRREFYPDVDFDLLEGEELKAFQAELIKLGGPRVGQGRLLILFETGMWIALSKSEGQIGLDLRRFLAEQVLPKLARESGAWRSDAPPPASPPPTASPAAPLADVLSLFPMFEPRIPSLADRREERLADAVRVRERWVEYCDLRLRVFSLVRLADELGRTMDPDARTELEVMIAEMATGLPLLHLFEAPEDPPPPAAANQARAA